MPHAGGVTAWAAERPGGVWLACCCTTPQDRQPSMLHRRGVRCMTSMQSLCPRCTPQSDNIWLLCSARQPRDTLKRMEHDTNCNSEHALPAPPQQPGRHRPPPWSGPQGAWGIPHPPEPPPEDLPPGLACGSSWPTAMKGSGQGFPPPQSGPWPAAFRCCLHRGGYKDGECNM